jgi:hypothetical protein
METPHVERLPRFRQTSLHSLKRRVGLALRRRLGGRFVPEKQVRLIQIGGARCKRVTVADTWSATQMARNLERFRSHRMFPVLIAQSGNELLLEFVEGRPLGDPLDAAGGDLLADFFAVLYAQDRHAVDIRGSGFAEALLRDLAFLGEVGVLEAGALPDLTRAAEALTPAQVYVGHDYLDPLSRNFVVTPEGRLVAIDIEALLPNQLLGSGVAKAALRMPGANREQLLARVRRTAGLDLTRVLPFVELAVLADWTKRALLKGRHKLVQPELFEPYRRRGVR